MLTTISEAQSPSAVERAFAVTELREAIISHLPCKDVLLAQRVRKDWKATITGSLMLQRALGFVPNGRAFIKLSKSNTEFNEMMTPSFMIEASAIEFVEASEKPDAWIINPLLESFCRKRTRSQFTYIPHGQHQYFRTVAEPSWPGMLLTQPPATSVSFGWQCTCQRRELVDEPVYDKIDVVRNSKGVTFSDILQPMWGDCAKVLAFKL